MIFSLCKCNSCVIFPFIYRQNTSDLSDLVSSGRDRNPEEVALVEECVIKGTVFRAERLVVITFVIDFSDFS